MKKILVALSALTLLLNSTSCNKESCEDKTVASETAAMNAYATANGITTTTHGSGLLYEIITPGTGTQALVTSTVSVKYTGKLLDGTVFDAPPAAVSFAVGGTIPGFQLALQLLKEGGKIKVIIPSSLAYGCQGRDGIPSSAILYFEIELIDVL